MSQCGKLSKKIKFFDFRSQSQSAKEGAKNCLCDQNKTFFKLSYSSPFWVDYDPYDATLKRHIRETQKRERERVCVCVCKIEFNIWLPLKAENEHKSNWKGGLESSGPHLCVFRGEPPIHVTGFSSISYCSNSENWPQ